MERYVNTNELKGWMAKKEITGAKMAEKLGISHKTFYTKMKSGNFTTTEMHQIITYLGIDNEEAISIFLAKR